MKHEERRQQIITAAGEIVSEKGIKALTVRNIAKKIKTTNPAIYKHFENKDEILSGMIERFKTQTTGILEEIAESDRGSTGKIKIFFLGRCAQFQGDRAMAAVMFPHDIFIGEKKVFKKIIETIDGHKVILMKIIKEGQKKKEITAEVPPEHLFIMIMGALRLLVTGWRGSDYCFDLYDRSRLLWSSVEKLISLK